jgi:hypothetical protein
MATISTATLVDGRWVTRSVDVATVVQQNRNDPSELQIQAERSDEAPCYGILTQTVIDSPIAHWILPVRLERNANLLAAFIGVRRSDLIHLSTSCRCKYVPSWLPLFMWAMLCPFLYG